MTDEIQSMWEGLEIPPKPGIYSTKNVPGTNAWVYKTHDKSLGFLLSGVSMREKFPKFENILFKKSNEKIVDNPGKSPIRLQRCLEINLDPNCDASLLARILDIMSTEEPSGRYGTQLLISVIERVVELVRKPPKPPTKSEVIGAWGELWFLFNLIKNTTTVDGQRRLMNGWEASPTNRAIIDFSFPHLDGGTTIEFKTSTVERNHHFHGFGQVTKPEEFSNGWVGSLLIQETNDIDGINSFELVKKLIAHLTGSENEINESILMLESKLKNRGEACKDQRFFFQSNVYSLKMVAMSCVPCPGENPLVSKVEWSSSVEGCEDIDLGGFNPVFDIE